MVLDASEVANFPVMRASISSSHGNAPFRVDPAGAPALDDGSDAADGWQLSVELATRFLLGYREGTRAQYGKDLRDWFTFCAEAGVVPVAARRSDVEIYVRTCEGVRGLAPATVARRFSTLSGYYNRAVEEDVLPRSPTTFVRRPRVLEDDSRLALQRDDIVALLGAAAEDGARAHALVSLLVYGGLRINEALGADVTDLVVDGGGRRVLRIVRKGGKRALVPLAAPVVSALDRYLDGRTEGPLIVTRTGRRFDRPAATRLLKRLGRRAIPHLGDQLHPHALRHAFATMALDAGSPLRDVQDAMGHADPWTTRRYDRARFAIERHPAWRLEIFLDGAAAE